MAETPGGGNVFKVVVDVIGGIVRGLIGGGGGSVSQLSNALVKVANTVSNSIAITGEALDLTFRGGITALLGRVWKAVRGIQQQMKAWMQTLNDIIQWVRKIHDYLFRTFIGPILNVIQHIRQMLILLRIFHVKFAQKLDAQLAGIEGKIIGLIELIWTNINALISWAQIITTAEGLLNPAVLWDSIKRDVDILRGLVGLGPPQPLTALELSDQAARRDMFSTSAVAGRAPVWAAGKMPAEFQSRLVSLRTSLSVIQKGL